jgi:hypothetical protein
MKKIVGLSIVLAFLMTTACNQNIESEKTSDFEIISIHELTLKPGVDEKEFEQFVMNEVAPLYRQMKGQDLFLGRGYVGQRTGEYAIFITFETVEDRNNIYPLSGGFSEEFNKVMEENEGWYEKFQSMAEGFDGIVCTDYVKVGQ